MSEKLRLVLTGQAAFGESVLNALVEKGESVIGVFCPPDTEGKPADLIKSAAIKHGIAVFQFRRMRSQEAIDTFKSLNADLGVMAFVTDIVPAAIIDAPRLGTINFHPSLLPRHRGPSSINWPIIQGETKTGLTIFWPDAGLDTGPVLLQKEVVIEPTDTLGTVYFDKIFGLGVAAMLESVDLVRQGKAPRIIQDESQATYEGWCKAENVVIDWSTPLADIYNLVRGSDPSPGSGTSFRGKAIKFFAVSERSGETGRPEGEVVAISDDDFSVAAAGGALVVRRVQPDGGKKIAAKDWIQSVGLKTGDRFGG